METQIGARNLWNMMDETHGVLILWLLFSHGRDIFVHYQEKLFISGGSLVYRVLFMRYYIIWPRVSILIFQEEMDNHQGQNHNAGTVRKFCGSVERLCNQKNPLSLVKASHQRRQRLSR